MKFTLILPLLAVSFSFETAYAKDVAPGDARLRARALQEELSVPRDLSVAGIVPAVFSDGHGSKSSKSSRNNGVCNKRMLIAFDEVKPFPNLFPRVETPDDVSK